MKQEYSVQGFWAFPKEMQERDELLKSMILSLARNIAPVKNLELELFHSSHFQSMQGFWGLDPLSLGSESFSILGNFETETPREYPLYLKHPIIPFPGLIIFDSKFEHKTFKTSDRGLENLFLHFLYINDPKLGREMELVFNQGFYKCGEEISQNPYVKDLRIYRRDAGYTVVVATSNPKWKDFIQEWQRLQEKYRYEDKPDSEFIANGSGDVSLYSMGPLKKIPTNSFKNILPKGKLKLNMQKRELKALPSN